MKILNTAKLKSEFNHIFDEDGKQVGIFYYTNFAHDKGGKIIKDTSGEDVANEMVKRWNMHNEALDIILEFVRESKSNTPLVKKAVELLNKDKEL